MFATLWFIHYIHRSCKTCRKMPYFVTRREVKSDPATTTGTRSTLKFNHFQTVISCPCLPSLVNINHCVHELSCRQMNTESQESWYLLCLYTEVTVTVTTVTCSAIRMMVHSRVHSVPGVNGKKQKTLHFVLEWSSRTQEFQVGRQPIPSTGCSNRESPFINLPTHSWNDQVTVRAYSMNAAMTVKECQRRASTGWQCNRERARRTSCAQAGTTCTVFSLWSATNATPAKQEWHGRQALSLEQYGTSCCMQDSL